MMRKQARNTLQPGVVTPCDVDLLRLDPENPRLGLTHGEHPTQDDLLHFLWNEMAVNEVAVSIAVNGWFKNERLLVVNGEEAGTYTVVEGNRRLAAIKILHDRALRTKLGGQALDAAVTDEGRIPTEVPVQYFSSRQELWQYLGFEHVNGAKPWDSFSKAAYVAHVKEQYNVPLKEIASSIGDFHSTVRRLYRGFVVLRQAEDAGLFSREDCASRSFFFSHLYTALDYPAFQQFLGIGPEDVDVPRNRQPNLEWVFRWLYGSKSRDIQPIIKSQNPDLGYLRQVLEEPRAVHLLQQTGSLRAAYVKAYGEGRLLTEAVHDADKKLRYAMSLVSTAYDKNAETVRILDSIVEVAKNLKKIMKSQIADGGG